MPTDTSVTTARNLSAAAPEDVGISPAGLERIDHALGEFIGSGEIAGFTTLIARHGLLVHRVARGAKDLETAEPVAEDTIFHIYSMTKPVTAAAMMVLHQEGRWRASDPIAAHLPGFDAPQVFAGIGADGQMRLAPASHPPTIGELMTHTAGFTYGFDPGEPLASLYQSADLWRAPDLAEYARRVARLPLAYQPGAKWLYSLSMDLQGAIIERLSGQTLAAFMEERIFAPLGMVDTAFHIPNEKRSRLAKVYRKSKRRGLVPAEQLILPHHASPPALASGGGGLLSTAMDYARFAQMLLNGGEFGGERILRPESVATMTANHLSEEMLGCGFGVGHQQIRPGFGYGYNGAVFTDPALAGIPVGAGTYQWDGAAGTWFWIDPVNDLLFVGMIQRMDPDAPPLQAITQKLIAEAIL